MKNQVFRLALAATALASTAVIASGPATAASADAPAADTSLRLKDTCTVIYDHTEYYNSSWQLLGWVDRTQNIDVVWRNKDWVYGTLWGHTYKSYVAKNRISCPV